MSEHTAENDAPANRTRADHRAEAQRLLGVANGSYWQGEGADIPFATLCLAAAQVEATLALSASVTSPELTDTEAGEVI